MNIVTSPVSSNSVKAMAAVLGAAIALHGAPAHAQQSELDLLRQQLAQLQSRIDKLESAKTEAKPAAAPTVSSASKTPVVISGLLQQQANAYFNQDNLPAGTNRSNDTLRLRRGEIRVSAPQITSRVSALIGFDFAKADNRTNAGSPLQEFQLTYAIDKNKKAPKFFDIGQFKPGFGYESDLVGSAATHLTERAQIFSFKDLAAAAAPTLDPDGAGPLPAVATGNPAPRPGGGMGDSRDQGARLRGTLADGTVIYNIGIFNGLGERQNAQAGGDNKAIVGRVQFKPNRGPLTLGVSALQANTRGDHASGPLDRDGYNGFVAYNKDKISFQTEYAQLKSSRRNSPANFKNGKGYYAGVGYFVAPKVQLVGRYDSLKQEQTAGNGTSTETTIGANYFIKGNNAKIQANLVKVNGEPNALSTFDSLQLRTQFQLAF